MELNYFTLKVIFHIWKLIKLYLNNFRIRRNINIKNSRDVGSITENLMPQSTKIDSKLEEDLTFTRMNIDI